MTEEATAHYVDVWNFIKLLVHELESSFIFYLHLVRPRLLYFLLPFTVVSFTRLSPSLHPYLHVTLGDVSAPGFCFLLHLSQGSPETSRISLRFYRNPVAGCVRRWKVHLFNASRHNDICLQPLPPSPPLPPPLRCHSSHFHPSLGVINNAAWRSSSCNVCTHTLTHIKHMKA